MERTEQKADPAVFWNVAMRLAAELLQEGAKRSPDPLVWLAALLEASNALVVKGGSAFEADWKRACDFRQWAEATGVRFEAEIELGQESVRDELTERTARATVVQLAHAFFDGRVGNHTDPNYVTGRISASVTMPELIAMLQTAAAIGKELVHVERAK